MSGMTFSRSSRGMLNPVLMNGTYDAVSIVNMSNNVTMTLMVLQYEREDCVARKDFKNCITR